MLERRSSGLGGAIATQSDRAGSIGARVGPRLYLALLALLSLAACFLPLADHLGYELSELIALAAGVFLASLAGALWPLVRGPQMFAFHHLGGMYPGPIYDEAIRATRALWIFRADTLLYAAACAGIALLRGPPRPRRRGAIVVLI